VVNRGAFVLLILLAALLFSADDPAASVARLQRGFEQPPASRAIDAPVSGVGRHPTGGAEDRVVANLLR
jgi:hypothetical protein